MLLLSLLLPLLVDAAAIDGPVSISLSHKRRTVHTTDHLRQMAENIRAKYNVPTLASRPAKRQSNGGVGSVAISDENNDSSYFGNLQIGTPGKTFGFILDTGSSDLWVGSPNCRRCQAAPTFDPTGSSTFQDQNRQIGIQYGSGAIQGDLASDTVSIAGFQVQNQGFVVATQVTQGLLDNQNTDGGPGAVSGLLGLGFKAIANTQVTPLVQQLSNSGQLKQKLMSFYLERHLNDNGASVTTGGIFTLGDTNSSLFTGDIDFVNIPSSVTPSFWLIPVTGVSVGGNTVANISSNGSDNLAAIDTGTTLIGGPSDGVAAIYSQIQGAQPGQGTLEGYFEIPCNQDISISFTFGGKKSWPIDPVDFRLQAQADDGSVVCIGGIFDLTPGANSANPGAEPPKKRQIGGQGGPDWIVGDTFLKNVYSVFRFDPPSVGFAQLNPSLPGARDTTPGSPTTGTGGSSSSNANGVSNSNGAQVLVKQWAGLWAATAVALCLGAF